MARGGAAVPKVETEFPGVVSAGVVDRQRLGALVFGDPVALARLEAILHPLAGRARQRFLCRAGQQRRRVVALDIPLLLEGRSAPQVDVVVVVTCPAFLQKQRVLARPGMTETKFRSILARQMTDAEKRRRADIVIPTGAGRRFTLRLWRRLIGYLLAQNFFSRQRRKFHA
jgi:dephospho-CoA kinase